GLRVSDFTRLLLARLALLGIFEGKFFLPFTLDHTGSGVRPLAPAATPAPPPPARALLGGFRGLALRGLPLRWLRDRLGFGHFLGRGRLRRLRRFRRFHRAAALAASGSFGRGRLVGWGLRPGRYRRRRRRGGRFRRKPQILPQTLP